MLPGLSVRSSVRGLHWCIKAQLLQCTPHRLQLHPALGGVLYIAWQLVPVLDDYSAVYTWLMCGILRANIMSHCAAAAARLR